MAEPTPPAAAAPPPRRTSRVATAALALSLVFCVPPLSAAGFVLGIVALRRLRRHPELAGKGAGVAAIVAGLIGTILGTGWVYACVIPIYVGDQYGVQATTALYEVRTAEYLFHRDHGRYSASLKAIGRPGTYAGYTVTLAPGPCRVTLERADGGPPLSVGVSGAPGSNDEAYVAVAYLKRRSTGELECWSISSAARRLASGWRVRGGQVLREHGTRR